MSFTTVKLAWRNLWRNRTRTLIALGAITLAQLFVVSMGGLMAGMFEDMFETLTGPFVGHVRIKTRDWRRETDRARLALKEAREAEGDPATLAKLEAAVLEARGNELMFDEILDEAATKYRDAADLYTKAGDRGGVGRTIGRLARLAVRDDDTDEARRLFAKARDEFTAAGDVASTSLMSSLLEDSTPVADKMPERILHVTGLTERLMSLETVTTVSPRFTTAVLADSGEVADAQLAVVVGLDMKLETAAGGLFDGYGERPPPPPGSVILGRGLAKRLGAEEGDSVAVIGQRVDESPVGALFTVAAVIRSPVSEIDSRGIGMGIDDARELAAAGDTAHEIILRSTDPHQADELAARIRAMPGLADAKVQPWREANPEITTMLDMKDRMDRIFVLIVMVAAAAGIANTMVMSTSERTREFGMLLGVGANPGRITSMVLVESVILGVLGVVIGSLLGVGLMWVTSHTGIDYGALTGMGDTGAEFDFSGLNFSMIIYPAIDWGFVVKGVIWVSLTSFVTTILPALSASRLEPMEAMRS